MNLCRPASTTAQFCENFPESRGFSLQDSTFRGVSAASRESIPDLRYWRCHGLEPHLERSHLVDSSEVGRRV